MPRPKEAFETLYPCDFYTPEELLDADQMYTVYEIARLLQGLETNAEIDEGTEEILLDWAIPWVMRNADDLVVAEPPSDEEPGYYGIRRAGDLDAEATGAAAGDDRGSSTGPANDSAADDRVDGEE